MSLHFLYVSVQFCLKGHLQNDLYCVGWDVKPYLLTHPQETSKIMH